MRRGVKAAAAAAAELSRRHVRVFSRPVELGVVLSVQPLTVELVEGGRDPLVLDESGLMLGWNVRKYDQDHLLKAGDTLAIVQLSSEDFYAMDVVTDKEILRGVGTILEGAGTTKHITDGDMVVNDWLPVYDAAGTRVGWSPVFTSRT